MTVLDQKLSDLIRRCLPSGRFDCPVCGIGAVPMTPFSASAQQSGVLYEILIVSCAACYKRAVFVCHMERENVYHAPPKWKFVWKERVHPRSGRFQKRFPNTDEKYLKHYKAACCTIEVSPEAAAAMARRCLEELLQDQGYKHFNIVDKIKALLNESDSKKHLPLDVHSCVDHIRTFGNFGVHPLTDNSSLQVVDVEPGEAEWCIDILEQLFEHYFERPAAIAQRIAKANAKLQSVGKKPALS